MDHTTGDMQMDDEESIKDILNLSKMTIVHAEGEHVKKVVDIMIKYKIKINCMLRIQAPKKN